MARDLRRRKARERHHLFVAEGVRAVEELSRSALRLRGVLVAPQLADAPRGSALLADLRSRSVDVAECTSGEFASAAQTDSPQGVLAVAEVPGRTLDALPAEGPLRIVVLDAVQDPGNVGTIVRTAAALGAAAVIAMPGTVDLWSAKVVRSAMGSLFHLPAMSAGWSDLDAWTARTHVECWGADVAGTSLETLTPPARLALVVGNEGAGMSADGRARVSRLVSLPIASGVESLNVAVATGILLYELRP